MLEAVTILTAHACPPSGRDEIRERLAEEFPSLRLAFVCGVDEDADVRASEFFEDAFDLWQFDGRCEEQATGPWSLRVVPSALSARDILAVVTRCQRLIARRNESSASSAFDEVLDAHRRLHDLDKPLVLADYRHSLDVWQWLFRIARNPSFPLQCAALFHDVERLISEADARIEHLAPDYQRFKDAHAAGGAALVREILGSCGVAPEDIEAPATLVARHERPDGDEELAVLNDADALSFFSMNSAGYADYFGLAQTEKKVAYTWNRMSPAARSKLATVRLRSDVRRMVEGLASSFPSL